MEKITFSLSVSLIIYKLSNWHSQYLYQKGIADNSLNLTQYRIRKEMSGMEHHKFLYCMNVK